MIQFVADKQEFDASVYPQGELINHTRQIGHHPLISGLALLQCFSQSLVLGEVSGKAFIERLA